MADHRKIEHPLAPVNTYPRSDEESNTSQSNEQLMKREKRIRLAIYIAAFAVFQTIVIVIFSLTVMKVKTPKLRLSSTTEFLKLNTSNGTEGGTQASPPSFDISFMTQVRVKNTNFGPYKYESTNATFLYQGVTVGEFIIPKGKAGMLSTKKVDVTVNLNSKAITSTSTSTLRSELQAGVLKLDSQAKLSGKVELMFVMKKKKSAQMNCTVSIHLLNRAFQDLSCKFLFLSSREREDHQFESFRPSTVYTRLTGRMPSRRSPSLPNPVSIGVARSPHARDEVPDPDGAWPSRTTQEAVAGVTLGFGGTSDSGTSLSARRFFLPGHLDVELNDAGRQQAAAVADRLSREPSISVVYSSDLKRALETAQIIAASCGGQEVIKKPDLRERHLGDLQGLVLREAAKLSPKAYQAFLNQRTDQEIPGGGESLDQLYERCTSSLERIGKKHKGERVIVVTHGGVIRTLYKRACPNGRPQGKVLNTSINIFCLSDKDEWTIKLWGDVSHLDKTGFLESGFGGDRTSG